MEELVYVSKVAVAHGISRHRTTIDALELLEEEIEHSIEAKSSCTILIKPNMVVTDVPSAATNAETLRALLEHLPGFSVPDLF